MGLRGNGMIAIWHDVKPEARADYFEWHNREHMRERVAIPGFLRGRRFGALDGTQEFFTLYEAESLNVLTGDDYRTRLDNPTPWTRRVAAQLHANVRSLCRVALTMGSGSGGFVMTWRYDVAPGAEAMHRSAVERGLRALIDAPQVVAVHLGLADAAASTVQTVEKMTGGPRTR